MDDHSSRSSAEDEEDDFDAFEYPELSGTLSKWTNYIHGWQDRHIVLKDNTLSYYKSETDLTFGCRGAISLQKAQIRAHEFDELRFDLSVNDSVWYMRAGSNQERQKWVDALEASKAESGYGSESNLQRHGSRLSLTSVASLSTCSTSSFKKGRGLREKLAEMETFRDILCRQVDTLQAYFDTCAEVASNSTAGGEFDADPMDEDDIDIDTVDEFQAPARPTKSILTNSTSRAANGHGHSHLKAGFGDVPRSSLQPGQSVDFKGEAITFKATTAGILATLSHCLELMTQREESWRRRLEKEQDRRKKYEEAYKHLLSENKHVKPLVLGGPDFEEGPHCAIGEDEFFDAIDAALDKNDKEEELQAKLREHLTSKTYAPPPVPSEFKTRLSPHHPLYHEIESILQEHVKYSELGCEAGVWQLLAEDGEMKVYKRELEVDGVVMDPLKAVHVVKGITGHEMCHYFFDMAYRLDWDHTLDNSRVVEKYADDTVVTHQTHRRVWPSTARDSVFWSHIRCVGQGSNSDEEDSEDAHNIWVVCNHSTENPAAPPTKCVRVKMNVALVCQTFIEPPADGLPIGRDSLTCKITYSANVNPGGWAPASVLRAVYKREYPKFLKRFTQYVRDMSDNKPILF